MNRQPTPIQLSGQQFALYTALAEKDQRLAKIYYGSLLVFQQNENPDLLALAAHGLRELMEKLPRHLDLPAAKESPNQKQPNLTQKVQFLRQSWTTANKNSKCLRDAVWEGTIDRPLQTFLKRARDFFTWHEGNRPSRKQQAAKVLRSLDPQGLSLPTPIEQLRIEEWEQCRDYFERVSHHDILPLREDLLLWITTLERFLLDRLRPRTFEDFTAIDRIIDEGEADA